MKKPLLTFFIQYADYPEAVRRSILREVAVNGAKHIVLSDCMISAIIRTPALADTFMKEVTDANLDFVDSHAPFGVDIDMNAQDDFNIVSTVHKLHLHIAAQMNVKTMTIHIGNNCYVDLPLEEQTDRICRMLDILLLEAEKLDVAIAIENIWTKLNTPENLLRIKERFPSDKLGFCFDAGHANIMDAGRAFADGTARKTWNIDNSGEPAWDDKILEKMLPHIINCHLHDNCGDRDQHELPGNGSIDWVKTANLLAQAPRLQVIQSEVLTLKNYTAIKDLVAKFRELFPELD